MNSTSRVCEVGERCRPDRPASRSPGPRSRAPARPARCRSRRRASSCRGRAGREQHVIERFAALLAPRRSTTCRFSRTRSWPMYSSSSARAQARFVLRVLVDARRGDEAVVRLLRPASRSACFNVRSKPASDADPSVLIAASRLSRRAADDTPGSQRREHIVAQRRRRRRRAPAAAVAGCARGSRSFSSSTMRSEVFLPTPGIAVSRATIAALDRADELARLDAREHRQRELRADAADADQPLEQLLLEPRREAEQRSASSRTCVWMRSAISAPARRAP